MHSSKMSTGTKRSTSGRSRRFLRPGTVGAFLILTVLLLPATGCSSAPDTPEYEVTRKNQAARYAELGNAQYNMGNYDLALRYFDMALAENTAVDNLPGIAQSHNSIGRVFIAVGNLTEAKAQFETAIRFADLAEDREYRMQAHVNLGVVALQNNDTEAATRYLQMAEDAVRAEQAEPNAILYHSLGVLNARANRFDDARNYLERARGINREERRWTELASNYYMLASLSSRQGRYEEALGYARQALNYDKRAENSPGIAADLHALGQISEHLDDDENAYQYYLRSLRIYLALNQPRQAVVLLERLEDVASRTNRAAEADEFGSQRERIETALRRDGSRTP